MYLPYFDKIQLLQMFNQNTGSAYFSPYFSTDHFNPWFDGKGHNITFLVQQKPTNFDKYLQLTAVQRLYLSYMKEKSLFHCTHDT